MDEQEKIFIKFAEYGITQGEICGAIECLKRENSGRQPTSNDVVRHIIDYIQWRNLERGRKEGHLWYVAQLTPAGQKALELKNKVDCVFSEYLGQKGGE
jgi:hypothetical protein